MKFLFDHNLPRQLRDLLQPHEATLTKEARWDGLENGELLDLAQHKFDVLLTTDSNLYHQQKVEQFDITVIVLRAYENSQDFLEPLIPQVLAILPTIEPGKVYYLYADEKLRESDQRKGKGPASTPIDDPQP